MDETLATVPIRRAEFRTTDIAETHEILRRTYVDHRPRLHRPDSGFLFHSRTAAAGNLALDRLRYRGAVESSADPFDSITTVVVCDGWYRVEEGGGRSFVPGDVFMVPLGTPLQVAWQGIDLQNVRFPLETAARAASRLGVDAVDFRFDGAAPVSPRMQEHWIATVRYVTGAFVGPDPAVAHPLVHAAILDLIGTTALAVFPNTTMTRDYTPGPGRVPPAAVRRAMAFIDAHAGEPITVEDIARAANLGVRGLQAAFARHTDTTPTGYLRLARLHGAHRDLRDGDPARGDTVGAIARRWGFAAQGRFAVEYRKLFGRSPSHTLRT
ncbi:AraC family transcriptional regulator [Actinoplanes flavus]|uniref:AraC family transcriptional regulator n=1 Tax=Actinoplanes flavus TaxID=2820290 RepID=A0ABS3UWQ8_9ACTN|nr:AraC family transcriptional regulator [Actinoplanes flavus]MBO3743019.1 AraC family transcriptional regulator [Actinoplanes flavus]